MKTFTNEQGTKQIMQRVYGVWFLRRLYRNAAKLGVMFVVALATGFNVSYASIFENVGKMQITFSGMSRYVLTAFAKTDALVQVSVSLGLVLALAFVLDLGNVARRFIVARGGGEK